jgi:hypothetical protein
MRLATTTESRVPQRNRQILIISALFVVVVVLAAITAYAYFPGLFGVHTKVDSVWVTEFVNDVNTVRTSQNDSPLIPEQNLTTFAVMRASYDTANYQSVEGVGAFKNASHDYFGPSAVITEDTFFPEGYTPAYFLNYLKQYNPSVYQGLLTNSTYGYAITVGPYYTVTNYDQCKVYSIPPNTENITQYFESRGCQFKITDSLWLIIELSK